MLLLATTGHPDIAERFRHPCLGRLLQPRHTSSAEATAGQGFSWAADNDCFQGLNVERFLRMLDRIDGLPGCLFVSCPDVVGDHAATVELWHEWAPAIRRASESEWTLELLSPSPAPWFDEAAASERWDED